MPAVRMIKDDDDDSCNEDDANTVTDKVWNHGHQVLHTPGPGKKWRESLKKYNFSISE